MRSFRGDFISVAAVLAVPLGLAAVFPYGAIGFAASREEIRPPAADAAIVFLDAAAVAQAMRAAKSLPRSEENGRACTDLLVTELPRPVAEPVIPIASRSRPSGTPVVENGVPPFLPSRRAAAPVRIVGSKEVDGPPFPRSELLKLN